MIYNLNNDFFRGQGLNHFTTKYGIPEKRVLPFLEIAEAGMQKEPVSWIGTDYGTVPVFESVKGDRLFEQSGDKVKINFDLFNEVGRMLAGHLECLGPEEREKTVQIPVVDIYEKMLLDAIKDCHSRLGKELKEQPLWPMDKRFAVCLTHDVDEVKKTYQYFTQALFSLKKGRVSKAVSNLGSFAQDKIAGNNPYWTFAKLMEIESALDVRSSLYFLQEEGKVQYLKPETWRHKGRRYRFKDPIVSEAMKNLSSGGWEVGLHGSFYSYNDAGMLQKEKKELEEALESEVCGIRQHNLNLQIPRTWECQEKVGLEYDTSLGFNDHLGFRYGTCFPFHPLDPKTQRKISVLEIPLIIEDIALFNHGSWEECMQVVKRVEEVGGVLTLLWHHSVLNDRDYPGYTEAYQELIRTCKERCAWITTGAQINKWWRQGGRRWT